MFNLFKPTPKKIAMGYFKKRNNVLRDFIINGKNIDEHVLATEVARNTSMILTVLDPMSPVDEQFITEEKKIIVGQFLIGFDDTITKLNKSGDSVKFTDPKKVFKRTTDTKWIERNRPKLIKIFDMLFSNKYDPDEAMRVFDQYKENSKLNHPLEYTSSVFVTPDELKFRLIHTAALAKDCKLNWDRLYLYLASIDTFENFEELVSLNK